MGDRVFTGTHWVPMTLPSATSRVVSAAGSTNATIAKAGPGFLYGIDGLNARASTVYIKFYDKATAPDENDTPKITFAVLASVPFSRYFGNTPFYFPTGISYRMVTGSADNSTGALTAADIVGFNAFYA
jgi:hypothetical protein